MATSSQDQLVARLRGLFREELQDNVRLLADGMSQLESEPSDEARTALVQQLFRAAHSLKGAAHAAGITEAFDPCHRLEDLLVQLRGGEVDLDDSVLRSFAVDVDALAALEQQLSERGGQEPLGGVTGSPRKDGPQPNGGLDAQPHEPRARVAVAALDELMEQAGALVAASQRLHVLSDDLLTLSGSRRQGSDASLGRLQERERFEGVADQAAGIERDLSSAARGVAQSTLQLRMQRFDDVTTGFERLTRELGAATGKQARLVLHGGDVQLDREVGTALREPLLHLIRNAVDHGIEAPDVRVRLGKPAVGTVTITASQAGGRVRITAVDDGAGIDVEALRSAAGDHEMGTAEALEVAFRPGVTTAKVVSEVSGRGVGLDAVRARIESLGGTIRLRSGGPETNGRGVEAHILVPATLALLRLLLVTVGDELVALPAEAVRRLHRVPDDELQRAEGRLLFVDGDEVRQAVPLHASLGFRPPEGGLGGHTVVQLAEEDSVLLVDRAVEEQEGLLHRLPDRAACDLVLGAVLLPFDRVALVLNPSACLRAGAAAAPPAVAEPTVPARRTILLAEDAITTRALEHSILAGAGYHVIDAADGAEAWRLLAERGADLVVSDVDMPAMTGIELCRAIRSSVRFRTLPVVLVTSLSSEDDRRRGAEAGADAYVVKSAFDQVALLDAVRRLL